MLVAIEHLEDQMLAVGLVIQDVIAYDPLTKAKLKKSKGHRKPGRPSGYFVLAPDGRVHVYEKLPSHVGYSQVLHFRAMTDEEAIAKANQMFPEKYRVFRELVYKEEIIPVK